VGGKIALTIAVILKIVALVAGGAIIVLTAMDMVTIASSMIMLGAGLAALALASFISTGETD
jgi:hypothetical protein